MGKKSKKKGNRQKTKKPQSTKILNYEDVKTLIRQADGAMEASEMEVALNLYAASAEALRALIFGTAEDDSSGGQNRAEDQSAAMAGGDVGDDEEESGRTRMLLLGRILGRSGEARASLGDAEGARMDFREGINLLETLPRSVHRNIDGKDVNDTTSPASVGKTEDESMMDTETSRIVISTGTEEDDHELHDVLAGLHLFLGQLNTGQEALTSYKSGVRQLEQSMQILRERQKKHPSKQQKDSISSDDDEGNLEVVVRDVRKHLCEAYCSIAELYLTDLCFEPDAEAQCEATLDLAVQNDVGDSSPDALQAVANLRLSQSRVEEAARSMMKAWGRMEIGCSALATMVGLGPEEEGEGGKLRNGQADELSNVNEVTSLPGYEFRCQSAKILLECASGLSAIEDGISRFDECNRCAEAAIRVLGSLMAENDEVIEVWYLVGCAFMAFSSPNPEMARHHWERAMEMLLSVKQGMEGEMVDLEDEDMREQLEEMQSQIEEVKNKLRDLGATGMEEG